RNNILSRIKMLILIQKIILSVKPDLVQTWMKSNYIAPILKMRNPKIKFILNFRHGVNKNYNIINTFILKNYMNIADGYIFVSNSAFKEFKNIGFSFKNSIVITNGFTKKDYNYHFDFNSNLVFGYVGRYNKIKNQEFLVKEFNEFATNKNVKLILAGRNLNFENFVDYISSENKNKFIWKGEVNDPFEIYNNIDALILTSISEGFPNVIGEAMSIGVPVISTNAGESFEIIGNSGYKINGSSGSLTKILNKLFNKSEVLKVKSQMAYQEIQDNYLIEKKVDEYIRYYEKIIGGK
ncbi:MAG: glycosyltransferase, partial [Staphylococcus equorum]|nr:glycosyltransferase [Staphylococcus equorum]